VQLWIHPTLTLLTHPLLAALSATLSLIAHKQAKLKAQILRIGRMTLALLGRGLHLMTR